MNIEGVLKIILQQHGNTDKEIAGQSEYLSLWEKWYKGFDSKFHKYTIYNGDEVIRQERKPLKMGKVLCEDAANFLLNERCDIIIPEVDKPKFDNILKKNNFWNKANELYEKACGLSLGAFVESVDKALVNSSGEIVKGEVKISFINATKIFPITIENGEITECAFVSKNTDYIGFEVHLKDGNGNYVIYDCKTDKRYNIINGEIISFETLNNIKLFQPIFPNLANNLDINSAFPISLLANVIDNLKAIDEKYDAYDKEFNLGRKRIFLASEIWKFGTNGQRRLFDPSDTVFYTMPKNINGENMITISAEALREQSYIAAINHELNLLSKKVGFGLNYYNLDSSGRPVQTATAVVSMNSDLMRTIKKHEIVLEKALIDFTKAIIFLSNSISDTKFSDIKEEDIQIKFDDSIFEDRDSEMARDRLEINDGTMSLEEYRQKWYANTEEDAIAIYQNELLYVKINKYLPALQARAMTPRMFVNKVWGDKDFEGKEELIEYITNNLNQSALFEDLMYNNDN